MEHPHPEQPPPEPPPRRVTLTVENATVLRLLGFVLGAAALVWLVVLERRVLTWLLVAAFVTVALEPLVELLERWLPRLAAVILTGLGFLLGLAGLSALVVWPLLEQWREIADALARASAAALQQPALASLDARFGLLEQLSRLDGDGSRLLAAEGPLDGIFGAVIGSAAGILTIALLSLFLLYELPVIGAFVMSLLDGRQQESARRVAAQVRTKVAGWVLGNALISLIAGSVIAIPLLGFGVPGALALAVWLALLDTIPVFGALLGALPAVALAFTVSPSAGIAVLATVLVFQVVIENHLLAPLIMRRTMAVSPFTILIASLLGVQLLGLLGALLALPVAGTLQVLAVEAAQARRARLQGSAPPAAPPARNKQ